MSVWVRVGLPAQPVQLNAQRDKSSAYLTGMKSSVSYFIGVAKKYFLMLNSKLKIHNYIDPI